MTDIRAFAAADAKASWNAFAYDPGPLGPEEVEVKVAHCGVCHSDLSMLDNEWSQTRYPFVGGHEAVGTVVAIGDQVKRTKVGDRVGVGWYAQSCMQCSACLSGYHNLCRSAVGTISGRHGGFADRVRLHWAWATPLPAGMALESAGPLFCGGITVFSPIVEFGVRPTMRVGVVGIGGLGHMAVRFLRAWGCEVTAFTSSESKRAEAMALGAHAVVATHDAKALAKLRGAYDFILVTANVKLDWNAYIAALAPKGRLHLVGAVLEPIPVQAFSLIGGQKSISGSPLGNPDVTRRMLEFCVRHGIAPQIERFPMSKINDAFEHLKAGRARYRIVLDADFT